MDQDYMQHVDWHEVANRFYNRLKVQKLNMEDPAFFHFMFGHYNPNVSELQELQGYGKGLSVAKDIFMRSIYEVMEESGVLTGEVEVEESDLFPDEDWDD